MTLILLKIKHKELGVKLATIDEIARQVDFVTVHTPLTPKTRGIVNADFFQKQNQHCKLLTSQEAVSSMKMIY